MPKIRCHFLDCTYLVDRYCIAVSIELNPDSGCLTYSPNEDSTGSFVDEEDLDWGEDNEEEDEDLWGSEDVEDLEDDIDDDRDDY